jgi:hypothetical protein
VLTYAAEVLTFTKKDIGKLQMQATKTFGKQRIKEKEMQN